MAKNRDAGKESWCVIVAVDGTKFYASRDVLSRCGYFQAALREPWARGDLFTGISADSLRVLLDLLRYGPRSVPALDPALSYKVVRDADYLGIPREDYEHLSRDVREPDGSSWARCPNCCHRTCREEWHCASCGGRVPLAQQRPLEKPVAGGQLYWMWHVCDHCGPEYAQPAQRCLVCNPSWRRDGAPKPKD